MIIVLASPKPGSGVSTTAALLALTSAIEHHTVLVDLHRDQHHLLGVPDHAGLVHVTTRLDLATVDTMTTHEQVATIARHHNNGCHVIVDAGEPWRRIWDETDDISDLPATHLWVIRPCFLALGSATRCTRQPHGVILLNELGRALGARDVEAALRAPVVATIDVHHDIARVTDAGLLTARPPRASTRALTPILHTETVMS